MAVQSYTKPMYAKPGGAGAPSSGGSRYGGYGGFGGSANYNRYIQQRDAGMDEAMRKYSANPSGYYSAPTKYASAELWEIGEGRRRSMDRWRAASRGITNMPVGPETSKYLGGSGGGSLGHNPVAEDFYRNLRRRIDSGEMPVGTAKARTVSTRQGRLATPAGLAADRAPAAPAGGGAPAWMDPYWGREDERPVPPLLPGGSYQDSQPTPETGANPPEMVVPDSSKGMSMRDQSRMMAIEKMQQRGRPMNNERTTATGLGDVMALLRLMGYGG